MTLEELDNALTKVFGLDFSKEECRGVRDRVLARYGRHIQQSKGTICGRCWFKEKYGDCRRNCLYNSLPDNPVEVARRYLSTSNDVGVFPFLCLFVIPLYEEETGERDTMKKISSEFMKRWKRENPTEFDMERL